MFLEKPFYSSPSADLRSWAEIGDPNHEIKHKDELIWAELELISWWLVVVAHDGDNLAKGMRERKNA